MTDPKPVTGNVQDKPGASCSVRESYFQWPPNPTMIGVYQMDTGAKCKTLNDQNQKNLSNKIFKIGFGNINHS